MPFKSQAQERAAFGGYLGPEMKAKAPTWAAQTNQAKLPKKVGTHRHKGAKRHSKIVEKSNVPKTPFN